MLKAALLSGLLVVASSAGAEPPPLLKTADAEAIAAQVSGGAAKRTVVSWPPGIEEDRTRRYGETALWYGHATPAP